MSAAELKRFSDEATCGEWAMWRYPEDGWVVIGARADMDLRPDDALMIAEYRSSVGKFLTEEDADFVVTLVNAYRAGDLVARSEVADTPVTQVVASSA